MFFWCYNICLSSFQRHVAQAVKCFGLICNKKIQYYCVIRVWVNIRHSAMIPFYGACNALLHQSLPKVLADPGPFILFVDELSGSFPRKSRTHFVPRFYHLVLSFAHSIHFCKIWIFFLDYRPSSLKANTNHSFSCFAHSFPSILFPKFLKVTFDELALYFGLSFHIVE